MTVTSPYQPTRALQDILVSRGCQRAAAHWDGDLSTLDRQALVRQAALALAQIEAMDHRKEQELNQHALHAFCPTRFKEAREQAGLSIGQAARRVAEATSNTGHLGEHLLSIEHGAHYPSLGEVAILAELYCVDDHWLLGHPLPPDDETVQNAVAATACLPEKDREALLKLLRIRRRQTTKETQP